MSEGNAFAVKVKVRSDGVSNATEDEKRYTQEDVKRAERFKRDNPNHFCSVESIANLLAVHRTKGSYVLDEATCQRTRQLYPKFRVFSDLEIRERITAQMNKVLREIEKDQ
jgi:hypothetical protein